ncbi:MAG: lytic transglycosylase domain-containing protein [Myxococcota bacterium]
MVPAHPIHSVRTTLRLGVLVALLGVLGAGSAASKVGRKRAVKPVSTTVKAQGTDCGALRKVKAPWLSVRETPGGRGDVVEVPASLERRVKFWMRVWGETPQEVTLLVDRAHPWVQHAEVDCQDLFDSHRSWAVASKDCQRRVTLMRKQVVARLKSGRDDLRLLRELDGQQAWVKQAPRNVVAIRGKRAELEAAMRRAGPHLGHVENVFGTTRVPAHYARLAIVESQWQTDVVSPSGAVGAFQLMPDTGQRYLLIRDGVDERRDPIRSGRGAARYLAEVVKGLGSWPLAITAYNSGPSRIKQLVKRHKTRELGHIVDAGQRGGFGFDGQNYYAQVAAVARLTADRDMPSEPPRLETVELRKPLPLATVAACLQQTPSRLARANPALGSAVVRGEQPVPKGYVVAVEVPEAQRGPLLATRE